MFVWVLGTSAMHSLYPDLFRHQATAKYQNQKQSNQATKSAGCLGNARMHRLLHALVPHEDGHANEGYQVLLVAVFPSPVAPVRAQVV